MPGNVKLNLNLKLTETKNSHLDLQLIETITNDNRDDLLPKHGEELNLQFRTNLLLKAASSGQENIVDVLLQYSDLFKNISYDEKARPHISLKDPDETIRYMDSLVSKIQQDALNSRGNIAF